MLPLLALFAVSLASHDVGSSTGASLNRRDVISGYIESGLAMHFGSSGKQSEILASSTVTLNGGGTHNFFGNIDNSGSVYVNQQSFLREFLNIGGQTSDWVGHDDKNGNLNNRFGGLIQLNDIGSMSAPTYDWSLRSFLNDGTIQWCGRGDTGGSTFQLYVDLDGVNNGLISYEQSELNLGASFVWRNPTLTTTAKGANIYNNGAFRLINVVYHNVQNVYGSGCWVIGQGSVLYLEDGTGIYQNPTRGPSFPQQSITFQDSTATLHLDTAVYSHHSDFGAQLHNFGSGNAIEFYEKIDSFKYAEATGVLTVTMASNLSVNLKVGFGYEASGFYQARNPQHYNTAGFNAIFYMGIAPSQSLPSQCAIGLGQEVCSGVPPLNQPQPPATTSSNVLRTSTATASSTITSSAISSSSKPVITTSSKASISSTLSKPSSSPTTTQSSATATSVKTSSSPVMITSSATTASVKTSSSPSASLRSSSSSASVTSFDISSSTQSVKTTLASVTPSSEISSTLSSKTTFTQSFTSNLPSTSTSSAPQYGQVTSTKTETSWSTVVPATTCSQACAALPTGAGPVPQPDKACTFSDYDAFHAMASSAPTSIHAADGGEYVQSFKDLGMAVQPEPCMGTYALGSYNVSACAAKCDTNKGCKFFNVFVERDPALCPAPSCPNPGSSTFYMCTLWGSDMDSSSATYQGKKVGGFEIVITASNGYCKH